MKDVALIVGWFTMGLLLIGSITMVTIGLVRKRPLTVSLGALTSAIALGLLATGQYIDGQNIGSAIFYTVIVGINLATSAGSFCEYLAERRKTTDPTPPKE